jgi:hypothetical protein
MSNDGTGMMPPSNNEPSGAVTSNQVGRKSPSQGKFRSGIKLDTNKHGIRRETPLNPPKKTGRKKV